MKPKSVLLSKKETNLSHSTTDALHEDMQALVPSESVWTDCTQVPTKNRQYDTDSESDSSERRKRKRKRIEQTSCYATFCFCFGMFSAGVFTALSVIAYYGMTNDCYFRCVEQKVGTADSKDAAIDGQLIDFIPLSPSLPKAQCADSCVFTIVESIPQNLTYEPGRVVHPSTYYGLKTLLSLAKQSVHIASYYWTLQGSDVAFHDHTASEGEDIFNSLLAMSKADQVSLKIAQNAENSDTDLLAEQGHAQVRTLNFTRLVGSGILHTKFWLIDGQHFYIGSANLDWRSLTQVKELGVLVRNCPCLGGDLQKIFDVYWYLGQPDAVVPPTWPAKYNTCINAENPINVHFNKTQAPVYMSSSPPEFCPSGRTVDIDAILDVIHKAQKFIYIAVMDYSPSSLYMHPNKYWPVIDDALREAAFDRNVTVHLLASKWAHTMEDMPRFLCSLRMLKTLSYPKIHLDMKLFEVPSYTKNQSSIPYARVNHNKYMVTDQHAYIGTSNWSADYFINTGGVGFIVNQPNSSTNTTQGNLRQQLEDVFLRDWFSNYTHDLMCDHY